MPQLTHNLYAQTARHTVHMLRDHLHAQDRFLTPPKLIALLPLAIWADLLAICTVCRAINFGHGNDL